MNIEKKRPWLRDKGERKIHSFLGKVMVNKQEKDYLTGKKVFRLDVELENKDELKEVSVYPRKVNEEIWNEVISNSCLGKKYLFSCEKITTALHLKTWKELPKS